MSHDQRRQPDTDLRFQLECVDAQSLRNVDGGSTARCAGLQRSAGQSVNDGGQMAVLAMYPRHHSTSPGRAGRWRLTATTRRAHHGLARVRADRSSPVRRRTTTRRAWAASRATASGCRSARCAAATLACSRVVTAGRWTRCSHQQLHVHGSVLERRASEADDFGQQPRGSPHQRQPRRGVGDRAGPVRSSGLRQPTSACR